MDVVTLERANPNDTTGRLVRRYKAEGERVTAGELVAEVETTKAVLEVEAPCDGHVRWAVVEGAEIGVGDPMFAITATADEPVSFAPEAPPPRVASEGQAAGSISRKAEALIKRYNLDAAAVLAAYPDGRVGEREVEDFRTRGAAATRLNPYVDASFSHHLMERVAVIGVGGAATQIVDALASSARQRAVMLLDRNPALHGERVFGVPVVGSSDLGEVVRRHRAGEFDAVVIAFNTDLDARATMFDSLRAEGVPFANVLGPNVLIRTGARIGTGNVLLANTYVGALAEIQDDNFLSSHTCIEHHCRLGSHCAFGPRVTFSGMVTVGNRVRFGTQIAIEPMVTVGDRAVIASGSVLTANVAPETIVKGVSTARQRNRS
jgi:sugar O-acyltransferase (sialic acid O-acetyltransferase NeuD family)